ncbi:HD domain-containing protein [Schwartzia sp. (in: firmicutes)]
MDEIVEQILRHPLFRENMQKCFELEKERTFCHHDMVHALNVARICYILVLEERLPYRRELVYSAALLHDIGRTAQYTTGESHHAAGARLAGIILKDCGAADEDILLIQQIIKEHCSHISAAEAEKWKTNKPKNLLEAFDLADFWSRSCGDCAVREECYWEVKSDALVR